MIPEIETERLALRSFQDSDLLPLANSINNYRIVENTARIPWPYKLDDALAFASFVAQDSTGSEMFVITRKSDRHQLLGVIGLDWNARREAFELGYWLAEGCWGQGLGLEAAAAIVNHAFDTRCHPRLVAAFVHGNEASRRILDRLGFRITGHGRSFSRGAGKYRPVAWLELGRREWIVERQVRRRG